MRRISHPVDPDMLNPGNCPPADIRSPFEIPAFRSTWSGVAATRLGLALIALNVGWLVAAGGGSTLQAALVQTASAAPMCLLTAPSGFLGDAFSKRTILLTGGLLMAGVTAVLIAAVLFQRADPIVLLPLFALLNCSYAFGFSAGQATLFLAAGERFTMTAASLNLFSANFARIVSCLFGAYLVGINDVSVFVVALVLFLVMPFSLFASPLPRLSSPRGSRKLFSAPAVVLRHAGFRRCLIAIFLCSACSSVVLALLPSLVVQGNLGGPPVFALLTGCFGVGAVFSAPVVSPLAGKFGPRLSLQIASAMMGASLIAMASLSSTALGIAVSLVCAGFSWNLISAITSGASRQCLPNEVQSSAAGLYSTVSYFGLALGSLIWGAFGGLSIEGALSVAATFAFVIVTALRFLLVDNLRSADRV